MGAEESTNLPPVQTDSHCLCLIVKIPDKIQVINATNHEYELIREAISKTWGEGIQIVKLKCGKSVLSFKLRGIPFETGILSNNSRDMICEILLNLRKRGWQHLASTNLTCARDWFTFIFTRQRPIELTHLGYMSLSSDDKLQFVNLLSGTFEEALSASKAVYSPGCQKGELLAYKPNTFELVLGGYPWGGKSFEHVEARYLLIKMFSILLCKHQFVCTMNIKRTEDTFVVCSRTSTENINDYDFVIVSLRKTKKIQIYNAEDELAKSLHQFINETLLRRGVRVEQHIEQMSRKIEYKFKFPIRPNSDVPKAMIIKFLISKLLVMMRAHGWKIVTGFDMSRGLSYKSELLFQRGTFLANCEAFCISPLDRGGLAFINAPRNIVSECSDIVKSHWHKPIRHFAEIDNIISYQVLRMDGDPWNGTSLDAYYAHGVMCHILKELSEKGYALVLTADVIEDSIEYDQGKSHEHNPNAWWFMHGPENSEQLPPSTPPLSSELAASNNVPLVNAVLEDDFQQPPLPDYYTLSGPGAPSEPQPYQPSQASYSGDNEALSDEMEPPPSYESVMRQEGRPF